MSTLAQYWKSILAFLSLVATNLAANFANSSYVWPQTNREWTVLVVTTVAGTWLVFQKANAPKVNG